MTCAATKIMHLELVRDLSATSLVSYLRKFVGRREVTKLMLSDNGKTFKADQFKAFNTRNEIIWRLKLAKAPWWGGLFEPHFCSPERSLTKCVKNCTLTYEDFYTVLVEIEGVLNSQPLTYLDENDIEERLTSQSIYTVVTES